MANQVAKKEDAPLATISSEDLIQFAGQGVEGLGTDDLAIPFINIIQSNILDIKLDYIVDKLKKHIE